MDEVIKSLKAFFYDRLTSPFTGNFIWVWSVWNWKILYVTIFVSEDVVFDKIEYIKNQSNYWVGLLYPFLVTIGVILFLPALSISATYVNLFWERIKGNVRRLYESEIVITRDEAIQLRLEIEEGKKKTESLITTQTNSLTQLRDQLSVVTNEAAQSRGIRILKAEYFTTKEKRDVTEKMNSMIKNGSIDIVASNDIFGEIENGVQKQLLIVYRNQDGKVDVKTINEGDRFTLHSYPRSESIKRQ
jgi:hypothetical protein